MTNSKKKLHQPLKKKSLEKLVYIENEIIVVHTIDIHLNKERIFFKVSIF